SIICSPMTSLKTSIKTITYLSDIGCLEIHGASLPGIAETVNFDHIRNHYFRSHKTINPTGIISIGPWQDLDEPHGRDVRFG
ncbi:hypothetical protein ODR90_21605, partial [Escherichia coli]|nr:hypothetical protein [Escherichia coli]MCV8504598.1 hypothetical protein [Escherichia coli]